MKVHADKELLSNPLPRLVVTPQSQLYAKSNFDSSRELLSLNMTILSSEPSKDKAFCSVMELFEIYYSDSSLVRRANIKLTICHTVILPLQVYRSLYHAIVMMYSENGIRTFYKGMPYMTEMRSMLSTKPGITTAPISKFNMLFPSRIESCIVNSGSTGRFLFWILPLLQWNLENSLSTKG